MSEIRAERISRLRERTLALYRAGFYTKEEGQDMMRLAKSLPSLVELEWMVTDAECMMRERDSVPA